MDTLSTCETDRDEASEWPNVALLIDQFSVIAPMQPACRVLQCRANELRQHAEVWDEKTMKYYRPNHRL